MYYSIKMKLHTLLYILPSFILLSACNGVDRSGEQPFAPTVETLAAEAAGDGVLLNGRVIDSPNSDVLECGFLYGNDTLRVKLKSEEVSLLFSAYATRCRMETTTPWLMLATGWGRAMATRFVFKSTNDAAFCIS